MLFKQKIRKSSCAFIVLPRFERELAKIFAFICYFQTYLSRLASQWRFEEYYNVKELCALSSSVKLRYVGLSAARVKFGDKRVSTICIMAPQHAHTACLCNFNLEIAAIGLKRWTHWIIFIRLLLLECRKPKLRTRRNFCGKMCCSTSHQKCMALTDLVLYFLVLLHW